MVAAFYPDAFSALTGINIADYLNRSVPIEDVLTGELLQLVKDVFRTGDTKPGFQLLERELAPLWQQARPHAPVYGNQVADWARSLGVRAAMSGVGRSTRQIERRFKSWTGHSRRTLNLFAKGEQTFKKARIARAENRFDPAGLAAELGYADQSHMGRQVKDITGFSPAEFMRRYESEEAFWSFRVMGERF